MSALISYRNASDPLTLAIPTATQAGYPVTNLQLRQLSTTWRASASNAPAIVIDFGAVPTRMDMIGLLGCNVANMTTGSLAIDYSTNGTSWNTFSASSPNDSALFGNNGIPRNFIFATTSGPYRYYRLRPLWTRIASAAYYEAARLWLGPAIVLPKGVDGTWQEGFIDPGSLDISAGGQAYEDERPRLRTLNASVSLVPADIAYGFAENSITATDVPSFQGMQMEAGLTSEVIVVPKGNTALWSRRTAIYGHIDANQAPAITRQQGDNYSVTFGVIEER